CSKAVGLDPISGQFLKMCAASLFSPVTIVFRECLQYGCLPDDWKIHRIIPIIESSDCNDIDNFRQISLLCILSK
uniref:Uncharacterized protein n=1 Tax=Amphimedon queenslandica TaxID=400682 RepID=A0A1X7VRZ7_AMPQE